MIKQTNLVLEFKAINYTILAGMLNMYSGTLDEKMI